MELGETEGERRVDDLGREAFDRAVAAAATIATQAVAQVHRRRLVVQTAAVVFLLCTTIGLGLAFLLKNAADSNARQQALSNCRLVADLATPLADFVASDASLREKQQQISSQHTAIGKRFAHLLGVKSYIQALKESNQLNAMTVNLWKNSIVPSLRHVAGTDCELRLP